MTVYSVWASMVFGYLKRVDRVKEEGPLYISVQSIVNIRETNGMSRNKDDVMGDLNVYNHDVNSRERVGKYNRRCLHEIHQH